MSFTTVFVPIIAIGLIASAVFLIGWTVVFTRTRRRTGRARYGVATVIDFIGLPALAFVSLLVATINQITDAVSDPVNIPGVVQRFLIFGTVSFLTVLRLVRFIAIYRENLDDLPLPSKETDDDHIDA